MYLLNNSHPDVFMEAYFKSPFAPVFFMVYMFVTFYYFNNVVSCCPLIWLLIYWSETKTSYLPCYLLNLKEQRRRNTESFIYINGIIMGVLLFWNLFIVKHCTEHLLFSRIAIIISSFLISCSLWRNMILELVSMQTLACLSLPLLFITMLLLTIQLHTRSCACLKCFSHLMEWRAASRGMNFQTFMTMWTWDGN